MRRTEEGAARVWPAWVTPAGLILLAILPAVGGGIRLTELAAGAEVTAMNARYFAAPVPIVLHAVSSLLYFILGAFQFWASFRRRKPAWHRTAGRILIPAGALSASTGIWMAWTYPPMFGDGLVLTLIRTVVGGCIAAFLYLGFAAVRRRELGRHRAWMMRAYALAIAAGTQPLTLAPMAVFPALDGELGYTLGLTAGWILNLAVAEWLIRRHRARSPYAPGGVAVANGDASL